jgi:hypothetical protein
MLERELAELRIEWPETPDIASAVAGRLAAAPAPRRRRRLLDLPAWQITVAATALVIAVVMAVPPARSAVLDLLGFSSVRIERGEPRPSRLGQELALGEPVTLDRARRRADFDVLVPAALGRPDAVYLDEDPAFGTRVDFIYRGSGNRVGLLMTEFRARATPLIEKTIGSGSRVERLRVDGDPAYFISGAQHGFAYIPTNGSGAVFEDQRLAGNTLLIDRSDGILLRLEGDVDRAEAVRIAESVR